MGGGQGEDVTSSSGAGGGDITGGSGREGGKGREGGGSEEGSSAPGWICFLGGFWWFGRFLVCLTGRRGRVRATAVAPGGGERFHHGTGPGLCFISPAPPFSMALFHPKT